MGEHIDEAKGRTKEAAGNLTDDDKLKREGKVDRAVSSVKDTVDDVADKVKDKVGKDTGPARLTARLFTHGRASATRLMAGKLRAGADRSGPFFWRWGELPTSKPAVRPDDARPGGGENGCRQGEQETEKRRDNPPAADRLTRAALGGRPVFYARSPVRLAVQSVAPSPSGPAPRRAARAGESATTTTASPSNGWSRPSATRSTAGSQARSRGRGRRSPAPRAR